MGFGKSSPFLAFSILVLCQAGSLQAAPFRSALESLPDPTALSEKEGRLLLAALVKAYVQGRTNELEQEQEQEETEGSSLDSFRAKRCSNLSTCVLGAYSKDLNNFHTFSGIGFGAETPGKKRDIASSLEKGHVTAQKRSCNTATCVTHRLAGLLSRSGGVVKNNFVPTNVGSEAFGRRRRDLHA